ncbi:MAG: PAS domain S-box protein [Candidatus Aminicenantes bacterium]|nr:PAS domain S-box protein [Candidatus Aminicenantes bacterium]
MEKDQKTTELMDLMARYSPTGLVFVDKDGRWLAANQAFSKITGFTLEDIPDSRTWFEKAFPEEEREKIKKLWLKDYKKAEPLEREFEIICKDGQKKWVSMCSSFLPEGQTIFSLQDITIRKTLEKEKERDELFYQALLETIPDMVVIADEQGYIRYISDSAVKFLGYDRTEELLGKNNQDFFPPEEMETVSRVEELMKTIGTLSPFITSVKRKDGQKRSIELSIGHVTPSENLSGVYIAIFRDITDRLELEQRLRQMLQEKEVLIREIHHRVKNNLQLILSLLRLQFYESSDPQVKEALKDAMNRVRSIALIYEGLLRNERVDRINLKPYFEKIAAHVLNLFAEKARSLQVNLELEEIEVDISLAHPCGLILSELMSNALKHAFPEGKGALTVTLKKSQNDLINLTVADDGVGLPPDLSSSKTSSLGWQIIRDLVEQLSGRIEVKVNNGSEIKISFSANPSF